MTFKASFDQGFHYEYQRNNKRSGQKNVRCFPLCNEAGHTQSAFCGRPVTCTISGLEIPSVEHRVRAFAEFRIAGEEDSELVQGCEYLVSDIQSKERRRDSPLLPYIRGEATIDERSVRVVFNRQLLGYHYGWTSSKHSCNLQHVLRAHAFLQPPGSDKLVYVGAADSPAFKLFSRRRTKPGLPPPEFLARQEAAVAATAAEPGEADETDPAREAEETNRAVKRLRSSGGELCSNKLAATGSSASALVAAPESWSTGSGQQISIDKPPARGWVGSVFGAIVERTQKALLGAAYQQQMAGAEDDVSALSQAIAVRTAEMEDNLALDRLCQFLVGGAREGSSGDGAAPASPACNPSSRRPDPASAATSSTPAPPSMQHFGSSASNMTFGSLSGEDFAFQPEASLDGAREVQTPATADAFDQVFTELDWASPDDLASGFGDMAELFENEELRRIAPPPSPGAGSVASRAGSMASSTKSEPFRPTFEALQVALARSGMRDSDVSSTIDAMHHINEYFMTLARDTAAFNSVIDAWSTPEGLRRLKDQVRSEQATNFSWSRERELDTFRRGQHNIEQSLFGEVRQCYRDMVRRAVDQSGMTVSMFVKPMEIAAKMRVVCPDPFFPPDIRAASLLHLQLHGDMSRFKLQDYGSRAKRFTDEAQQRTYAKDLLLVRRGIFRRIVCNRIVQEQRDLQASRLDGDSPVPPGWDISGSWIAVEEDAEERMRSIMSLWTAVSGVSVGTFIARVFGSVFSRLEITVSKERMLVQGQRMLVANPRLVVPFNGEPRSIRVPFPLPVSGLIPMLLDREVIGWFSRNPDGSHVINLCIGGPAVHSVAMDILDNARKFGEAPNIPATAAAPGRNGFRVPTHAEIRQFMTARTPPRQAGQKQYAEMRLWKRIVVQSGGANAFHMDDTFFLFPRKELAPNMKDIRGHVAMNDNPNCMRLVDVSVKYVRAFLDTTETDILALLS